MVPAYNCEHTIRPCIDALLESLRAIENPWELIIVNNGRNEGLANLLDGYDLNIISRTAYASAAYARNEGTSGFDEGVIVFVDSDVVCEKMCVARLIAPVLKGSCAATIGNYTTNVEGLSFAQQYKQLYIHHVYARENQAIKNDFWTAISAIDARVFHQIGGFDKRFKGANGEDQELGIRLTRAGYEVKSVPSANGQHLHGYTIWGIIKNDYYKGLTALKNSINNQVPLSDNRHAKGKDILAVALAVFMVSCLALSLFNVVFLWISLFLLVLWFYQRIKLHVVLLKSGGLIFWLKSLGLIIVLDWVRFIAVASRIKPLLGKIFHLKNLKHGK